MSDELKPCPFCGHAPEVHEIGVTVECAHADGTRDAYEMVSAGCVNEECPVMPCTEASGSAAEAAAKWNARAERTCENLLDDHSCDFECSECGFSVSTVPEGVADWLTPFWGYCPSCGAKVVG